MDFRDNGEEQVRIPKAITRRNLINTLEGKKHDLFYHQPGIFVPLSTVNTVGRLREEFDYISDRILLINVLKDCKVVYIPEELARFRVHSSSKTETAGYGDFGLEFVRAIRSTPDLAKELSRKEIRMVRVRAHMMSMRVEFGRRRYRLAIRQLLAALRISVWASVAHEVWRSTPGLRRKFKQIIRGRS